MLKIKENFKFKNFKSIREVLQHLGLQRYSHLFYDKEIECLSQFYTLDESSLKRMLIPAQARTLILDYISFYNKELLRRATSLQT